VGDPEVLATSFPTPVPPLPIFDIALVQINGSGADTRQDRAKTAPRWLSGAKTVFAAEKSVPLK